MYMYMRGTYAFTRAAHIHVYVYILLKIVLNKYTDGIIWSKESYICTNCAEHTHKQDISSGRASRWQILLEKSQTRPNPAAGAICPKIHRWHCDSTSRVGGRLRQRAAFGAADSHRRHHWQSRWNKENRQKFIDDIATERLEWMENCGQAPHL